MDLFTCKICCTEVVSTQSANCPECGGEIIRNGLRRGVYMHYVLIVFAVFIGVVGWYASSESALTPASTSSVNDPIQAALSNLEIRSISWYKGSLEETIFVDIIVRNHGVLDAKDIELTCNHQSEGGALLNTSTYVTRASVPAAKSRTITLLDRDFIPSHASDVMCRVTNLRLMRS